MAAPAAVPNPADFYVFAARRYELFAQDIDRPINALRQHRVYRWLRGNPNYRAAEQRLAVTPGFGAQLPDGWPKQWELLWFASLVAQSLGEYFQASSNPARRRVITKAHRSKAAKAASALRDALERGLEVGEVGDSARLYELLEKVNVSGHPRIASRKAGRHVPLQTFSRVLGLLLRDHYGEVTPAVVWNAARIVEPTISRRIVTRHLEVLSGTQNGK